MVLARRYAAGDGAAHMVLGDPELSINYYLVELEIGPPWVRFPARTAASLSRLL